VKETHLLTAKPDGEEGIFFHPSWPLLYEDNHLLALYKPAGLLVQGDRTGEPSLLNLAKLWIKERYQKPGQVYLGLVHRLDRPVAGVSLFCRTSKASARLSDQFRQGTVRKEYLAVVLGKPEPEEGRLAHHLERLPERSSRVVAVPSPRSQEARLSYRVLASTGETSLVAVELETGRHHQIRLQMAHVGHPLLGDLRYGAPAPLPQKQIALLAWRLAVHHPTRQEPIFLESPLPRGWPWATDEGDRSPRPPWNWSELRPLMAPTIPEKACTLTESVEE